MSMGVLEEHSVRSNAPLTLAIVHPCAHRRCDEEPGW